VVLRADCEPDDAIFYGPVLPLHLGTYKLTLVFSSAGEMGERLGRIRADAPWISASGFDVVAGDSASGEIEVLSNLPFRADFVFSRAADMRIKEMIVTRVR